MLCGGADRQLLTKLGTGVGDGRERPTIKEGLEERLEVVRHRNASLLGGRLHSVSHMRRDPNLEVDQVVAAIGSSTCHDRKHGRKMCMNMTWRAKTRKVSPFGR